MAKAMNELFTATPDPNVEGAKHARVGRTKGTPVPTCGEQGSYRYVASEFACHDGTNPFHGDAHAASDARQGNVGANPDGHIIDLYVVPCPEGQQRVFVDEYGGCNKDDSGGGQQQP
jgi:hypothetical protein